jgi:hypothetical protein
VSAARLLMTSLKAVGCSIGSSPGGVPCRILMSRAGDSHPEAFKEVAAVAFHWAMKNTPTNIKLDEFMKPMDVRFVPLT